MIKKIKTFAVLLTSALAFVLLLNNPAKVAALQVPPAPTDIPIVDQTGTLTQIQLSSLAEKIAQQRQKSSNEIAVLMIPSLEGDSLEDYSIRVARSWGIGTNNNNGVLLLISKDDRKLRIEVGYGLEGTLTDAKSSQIIRDIIAPEFKQGNYLRGISAGLTAINSTIENEYNPPPKKTDFLKDPNFWLYGSFMGFFGITWLGSILGRSKRWWAGGIVGALMGLLFGLLWGTIFSTIIVVLVLTILGLIFDKQVSKNYAQNKAKNKPPSWWAGGMYFGGGGSGSGGSGGFGGFSGGDFGGGGSSGGW